MRTSALLLPLGLVAAATAQILPPTWGVVGNPGKRAVEIQGIPGSWVAVPALDGPVDAVASSPRQICWTGAGALNIQDRQTGKTQVVPVPAGPARFAFDAQGALAAIWLNAAGQLYTADTGWAPVLSIPPATFQLLDLSNPGSGAVELLLRPAGSGIRAATAAAADRPRAGIALPVRSSAVPDLQLLVVDTRTGQTRTGTALADRSGPAALDSTGAVVFALDAGLPTVDSIQHLDHGWLLLTAGTYQAAWRRGMRPQGIVNVPFDSSPALEVEDCPGGVCTSSPVASFTMSDTAGGTTRTEWFALVNPSTSSSSLCVQNTSWASRPTSPADPSQSPVWQQQLSTPWQIDPAHDASMIVEFTPNLLSPPTDTAAYSATLTIQYYAGGCGSTGAPPDGVSLSALTITFDGQGVAAAQGPVIYNLSPATNLVGAPSFTLTVNGAGFESASQVLWEVENSDGTNTNQPLTTVYVNAQQLTATVPAALLSVAGPVTIQVSNPQGTAFAGVSPITKSSTFTLNCPLPPALQPTLALDQTNPLSNASVKVTVNFSGQNAPLCSLPGLLTLTFTPASDLPDDPSIFLDGNLQQTRTQPFTVPAGSAFAGLAMFGTQSFVMLDTGTTAGTFTLVAALGDASARWGPYVMAPASPVISSSVLGASADGLQLTLDGFDNSQATSGLAFEFYATDGSVVSPGLITMKTSDITTDFSTYYQANTQLAGKFQVIATFPVSGDVTQVAKVVVTLSNPSGTTTATAAVPVQ